MSAQFRQHSWGYKHWPERQIKAVVRKFVERGLPENDAESVVKKVAATERFFINLLVQEDIGIQLPNESDGAVLLDICCMILSYASLGCAPIAVYATATQTGLADRNLLFVSVMVSVALLALLGALKAAFSATSAVYAAVEACAVGLACSLVGFLVAHQLFRE
jgi:VIT1/CCC1 family predicted Fe2+/Mn2+ transporter